MTHEQAAGSAENLPSLPEGYYFVDGQLVQDEELDQLFSEDGYRNPSGSYAAARRAHAEELGIELIDVAVRSHEDRLVGFGSIAYANGEGELGEFVVKTDDRRKGIGRAILDERLRIAGQRGITRLWTNIEPTNKLREDYISRNFTPSAEEPSILSRGMDTDVDMDMPGGWDARDFDDEPW